MRIAKQMWKLSISRVAVSIIALLCFGTLAWLSVETQREHMLVNTAGIEVNGRVATKLQTLQSSGRGSIWVNTFRVHYFDEPTEIVHEPIVLEAFGTEIVLSDGRAAVGDFYAYDIEHVPDELYEQTEEGTDVPILYLPDDPEKVWLKATVDGKIDVDPTVPWVFVMVGLFLAVIPLINWMSIWQGLTNAYRWRDRKDHAMPVPARRVAKEEDKPVSVGPTVDQCKVGALANIPEIIVTNHYEDDLATYINFVLRAGQEEAGIGALVRQMEIGHAVCLSEYAGENRYHYVQKTDESGEGLGYELLKSDMSAAGDWERGDYEGAIWWLIPVADQNLKAMNGIWPATYRILKNTY